MLHGRITSLSGLKIWGCFRDPISPLLLLGLVSNLGRMHHRMHDNDVILGDIGTAGHYILITEAMLNRGMLRRPSGRITGLDYSGCIFHHVDPVVLLPGLGVVPYLDLDLCLLLPLLLPWLNRRWTWGQFLWLLSFLDQG